MTDEEVRGIQDSLKKLQPGYLPYPIFEQIARIVALPIIEVVPLRLSDQGAVQVLLLDRGSDDPIFPNMLHTPGTVVRATDETKGEPYSRTAMERLLKQELQAVGASEPHYVGSIFHDSKRGAEQALLFWVEVKGDVGEVGQFWDVEALPDTLIDSQRSFIVRAAREFSKSKNE